MALEQDGIESNSEKHSSKVIQKIPLIWCMEGQTIPQIWGMESQKIHQILGVCYK